ncbi:MAG TPA: hypothetical protein VFF73_33060 [Planctomycetota bacterium]|nr:hypothetical protein [Planctomycetota bacterium]
MLGRKLVRASALASSAFLGVALAAAPADASVISTLLGLATGSSSGPQPSPGMQGALTVSAAGQQQIATLMGALWPRMLPGIQKGLTAGLTAQSGQSHGSLTIQSLAVTNMDLTAPPGVTVTPLANGGAYAGERLELDLPLDPNGWSIGAQATIVYNLNLGFATVPLTEQVGISIKNLRAVDDIDLDTATDPGAPTVLGTHHPTLNFDLDVTTSTPIITSVLALLKPAIQIALQIELQNVFGQLDPIFNALQGKPGAPWGLGGPTLGPFSQQPDLHQAALDASEDMMNFHTPFGTVYQATFTSPTYRQGTVVSWDGLGDSPIWTGTYLAGEAYRFAATHDPQAEQNAHKVVAGIKLLLDVQDPKSGRLSRYAVPLSTAFGQSMLPIGGTEWIATVNGQQYVCEEQISRDQHDGVMMGLSVAYDSFTDPLLKKECGALIDRIVDFLASTGWNALKRDGTVSAPFVQSPVCIVAFTAAAERTNPRKYGPMRQQLGALASFDWIGTWVSTLDPIDSYYKWNLGHTTCFTAMRLETDPNRWRDLERSFTIMRRCVGHHRNAWFNAVTASLDPASRATWGPIVTDDLYRLVSRGRRDRPITNSTDPTIQKGTYTGALTGVSGTQISIFGQTLPMGTSAPITCALYPIPVEKRPSSDFNWQRCPFDLDGGGDPHHEAPGEDIITPYWLGKYDGFVP